MTSKFVRGLLFVATFFAAASARAESGQGRVGEWKLLWRAAETDAGVNVFRASMGPGVEFPIRARVLERLEGTRLVFFDADGNATSEIALRDGEHAMAAEDGSAHLLWSADSVRSRDNIYRFYRHGNPEPEWDAVAAGVPLLFAPDGSFFVIAVPDTALDRFQRAWLEPGGRVRVVDAGGDVRGEMPILPTYVRLTGDRKRIALLHPGELVVLRRDGVLDWTAELPIDAVVAREGHSQLEAAGGRIIATGTGPIPPEESPARTLHSERRGTLRAFTDGGKLLWKIDQDDADVLWFQISLALSNDGDALATFYADARENRVRLFDAETGQRIWERTTSRHPGTSCLSVSPDGQLVVLAHGDLRTHVVAWDREGNLAWEGELPFSAQVVRVAARGLLVAQRWVVQVTAGPG